MAAKRIKNHLKFKRAVTCSDLGRLVAEHDYELAAYYVNQERYVDRALNLSDPAVYFVGPKGVGKSAVLQMVRLLKSSESSRVINISPNDLAFSALTNISAVTPLLEDAHKHQWLFRSLWDYVLALEVISREFPNQSALWSWFTGLFQGRHQKEARKLLDVSMADDGAPRSLSMKFLSILKEIELSVEADGIKMKGTAKLDVDSLAQGGQLALLSLINSVAKNVAGILRHPYFILIDDLDLDWSDTPIQNALIAAMFTSIRNFSKPPNLKCVVAIQEKIYTKLPIEHKDKFHDCICSISWDGEAVREMVNKRLRHYLESPGASIWGSIFPENGFEKIWKSISGKPREAIRLSSLCIDEARHQAHSRVEQEDITTAVRRFSSERLDDLGSEWGHRFPGLSMLAKKFSGFKKEFQVKQVQAIAEQAALEVMCTQDRTVPFIWAGGYGEDHLGLTKILLECHFFLLKQSRTDEPKEFDSISARPLTEDDWVAIHPMYAPALGLVGA